MLGKFRAWDKKEECWRINIHLDMYGNLLGAFDRYEKSFFSGFADKNGKDIYQGDILTYKIFHYSGDADKYTTVVIFNEGSFICRPYYLRDICVYPEQIACEIIGNIYENPQLLHGEDSNAKSRYTTKC